MRRFRVLVLDDSLQTIEWVDRRIRGARGLEQVDPMLPVDVKMVHVELSATPDEPERWVFSVGTAKSLADACEQAPDLILVDYGFVDPAVVSRLRLEAENRAITADEVKGRVLTAYDLAHWSCKLAPLDSRTRRRIRKNLFESGKPVYLYSYRARELWRAIGTMDERARRIRDAFPKSRVSVIDARRELYNEDDFDSPGTSKYDSRFYSYQIAVLLDYIVQKEVLRALLRRSRFLRVRRTAAAAAALTAIGSALGVGGHWVGGMILTLFSQGVFMQAFAFGIGMLAVLFVFGFALALTFERLMEGLLDDEEAAR